MCYHAYENLTFSWGEHRVFIQWKLSLNFVISLPFLPSWTRPQRRELVRNAQGKTTSWNHGRPARGTIFSWCQERWICLSGCSLGLAPRMRGAWGCRARDPPKYQPKRGWRLIVTARGVRGRAPFPLGGRIWLFSRGTAGAAQLHRRLRGQGTACAPRGA